LEFAGTFPRALSLSAALPGLRDAFRAGSIVFPFQENTMNGNPVGWFEIHVQDMQRAQAFYEGVFGVKLEKLGGPDVEMLAFPGQMERYGAPGALVRMPGMASGGNSVLVYFSCADCAVEAQRAATCGGRVHRPKFSIGEYGHIALVADTEGNTIGLHSMA
jgi:hypothetical protein